MSYRLFHVETSSERYERFLSEVQYPLQHFKNQVECIPFLGIIGYLRSKSAGNFFSLRHIPSPKISLSPYTDDYSPNNKRRTFVTSLTALLCKRLAQVPYIGYVDERNKDALSIFTRILSDPPKLETNPRSVFFPYVKMGVNLTMAPYIGIARYECKIYVYPQREYDSS
jgi:hypothetical protein